jgi:hypothetical protein
MLTTVPPPGPRCKAVADAPSGATVVPTSCANFHANPYIYRLSVKLNIHYGMAQTLHLPLICDRPAALQPWQRLGELAGCTGWPVGYWCLRQQPGLERPRSWRAGGAWVTDLYFNPPPPARRSFAADQQRCSRGSGWRSWLGVLGGPWAIQTTGG